MVNTRRNNQGGEDLPPPPPVTMERWWCKPSCFNKWLKTCRIWGMGMGMHPLKLETKEESFWRDIHLSSSIPLTHSRLMIGYVQLRGNLRLYSVMTRRRFCMLLDSCKELHLIGEVDQQEDQQYPKENFEEGKCTKRPLVPMNFTIHIHACV